VLGLSEAFVSGTVSLLLVPSAEGSSPGGAPPGGKFPSTYSQHYANILVDSRPRPPWQGQHREKRSYTSAVVVEVVVIVGSGREDGREHWDTCGSPAVRLS
jgi:hypothetical protein